MIALLMLAAGGVGAALGVLAVLAAMGTGRFEHQPHIPTAEDDGALFADGSGSDR